MNKLLNFFLLPFLIVLFSIFAVGAILFLIIGILTLISAFKSDRKNLNGLLIAVAVFDVLMIPPTIFLIFIMEGTSQIWYIGMAVLLFLGFIFKIVDISLTKKRLKQYQQAKQEEYAKNQTTPSFDSLKTEEKENSQSQEEQTQKDGSDGVDFSKLGK